MRQSTRETAACSCPDAGASRANRRELLRAAGALALAGAMTFAGEAPSSIARQWGAVQPTVFPPHGTWTASPETEISFRGVSQDDLGQINVVGSKSGGHSGVLFPHSDANGFSYVPDSRFQPGEIVTVTADVSLEPSTGGALSFGVVQPAPTVPTPDSRDTENPESPPRSFRTRPDLKPPKMRITTPAENTADGLIFLSASIPEGQNGAMILDDTGELVWFERPPSQLDKHYDVQVQEYQGQPMITYAEAVAPGGYGLGHFVIRDSSYEEIAVVQVGNGFSGGDVHEFLLTPQSTALVTIYHAVFWDLSPAGGSKYGTVMDSIVQEIDIETGRVLFEWHSLDHVGVDEGMRALEPRSDRPYDYFHINSIQDDGRGSLYVSGRHTCAIYKIDRATGEVAWRLHGTHSDFEMGENTEFCYQHDARMHPSGELTLFDNAEVEQSASDYAHSRGLVLRLDESAMTATMVREYVHPTGILSVSQGNMQVLPNGNVFIGWGSAPVFSEMAEDGTLLFNGRFPQGGTSYRAFRFPWTGQPTEPPAVAVRTGFNDSLTVYASWNGATEVARWQVLAGSDPGVLAFAGTSPRTGFETAIDIEGPAAYVAVQAEDANGVVLGVSETIETT